MLVKVFSINHSILKSSHLKESLDLVWKSYRILISFRTQNLLLPEVPTIE